MDIQQVIAKLGRSGQVVVGGALLVFIFSFLPWYSASASGFGVTYSGHTSAWNSGIGAWFPVLLLVASGVVTVLATLGTVGWPPVMLWTLNTAAAILAVIIILLRWVTYPGVPSEVKAFGASASSGAGWALYVSLVLALAMAVFGYLSFTASGGSVSNLGAAFGSKNEPPAPPAPPQY